MIKKKWQLKGNTVNSHWLKIFLESIKYQQQIIVYNIYNPNNYKEKDLCWASLKEDMNNEDNINIIMGGNLNLIMHSNEKRGGIFGHDPFRLQLENTMQEQELVDIAPKNHRDTWNYRRLGKDNFME